MKEVLEQKESPEGELPQGVMAEARSFFTYAKRKIGSGEPIEWVLNRIEEEDISSGNDEGSDEMRRYRAHVLEQFRILVNAERKELEALALRAQKKPKK